MILVNDTFSLYVIINALTETQKMLNFSNRLL